MERKIQLHIVEKKGNKYKNIEVLDLSDFKDNLQGLMLYEIDRSIKVVRFSDRLFNWKDAKTFIRNHSASNVIMEINKYVESRLLENINRRKTK